MGNLAIGAWVISIHHLISIYSQINVQRNTTIPCLRLKKMLCHLEYTVLFCVTLIIKLECIHLCIIYIALYTFAYNLCYNLNFRMKLILKDFVLVGIQNIWLSR